MKIAIVSDSATGFTLADQQQYPEIMITPLTIIEENGNVYHDDNKDITDEQLYQKLIVEGKNIKTSLTSTGILEQTWKTVLQKYEQILFLPIADSASGQYKNAVVLAENPMFKGKVTVYETGAAAITLKNMVIIAWKLAQSGLTIPEITQKLDIYRKNYLFYLTPMRLNYLARGGRIPSAIAKVSNVLRLKVIIECKEKIKKEKTLHTMNSSIKEMINLISKNFYNNAYDSGKKLVNETLYILNGWCDNGWIEQAKLEAHKYGFVNIKVESLCNILNTHTGNNTIGFAITPNEWIK